MILITIIDLPLEDIKKFIEDLKKETRNNEIQYRIVSWNSKKVEVISLSLFFLVFDSFVNFPSNSGGIQILSLSEEGWGDLRETIKQKKESTILEEGTI